MRLQGGPLDGQERDWEYSIITVYGKAGRYVRWWDIPADFEPEWFVKGLPEPPEPERYFLWQPRGQYRDHPAVMVIRDAARGALER